MNSRTKLSVAILVVVVAAVVVMVIPSGEEEDTTSSEGTYSATVWFEDASGNQLCSEGSGDTVTEIVESAMSAVDVTVEFSNNGNVRSVDGETAEDGYAWTIQRWSSPTGWAAISSTTSSLWDGMTLALYYSEKGTGSNSEVTYSSPDIEVEYKVYFYVMILEELDSTEWLEELPLTEEEKMEGFWAAGTGSTANEALADAILSLFYPDSEVEVTAGSNYIEYTVDGRSGFYKYGTTSDMYGWFLEFLGWSDTEGEDGEWTYWVQYTYNPDASTLDDSANWDYNSWSWGLYDISLYHYMSVVLRTTLVEDTYTEIPTPSTIPEGL